MTKFKRIIAMCGLVLGILLPMTSTSATSLGDISSAGQVCLKDYYSSVFNMKPKEMRGQIYVDMTRSWCQVNDLLPLYDEYDEVRNAYLNAATNCGTVDDYEKTASEYEAELKRIMLEQYFIRNVRVEARNQEDIESFSKRRETVLDVLYKQMKQRFVEEENMVTDDELEEMYAVWREQYHDTLIQYTSCHEGPLWDLWETWFDFQDTWNSLDFDEVDKPERKGFLGVVTPDVDASGVVDGFNDGVQSVKTSWDKFMSNFRSSGEKRSEAEEQSDQKAEERGEDPNALPSDFNSYFQQLKIEESSMDAYEASDLRMAEYELLYGEIGAVSTTHSVILLDQLNQTINLNNVQDFPAIREAIEDIYGKQCNG